VSYGAWSRREEHENGGSKRDDIVEEHATVEMLIDFRYASRLRSLLIMLSMVIVWIQNQRSNNKKKLRNLTFINDFCECVLKSETPYSIKILLELEL